MQALDAGGALCSGTGVNLESTESKENSALNKNKSESQQVILRTISFSSNPFKTLFFYTGKVGKLSWRNIRKKISGLDF